MATAPVGDLVLLGWPPDGPTLRLDYRRFSYAGKFVTSNTGKAIVRADDADGGGTPETGGDPDGNAAPDAASGASGSDRADGPDPEAAPIDEADDVAWDDHVLAAAAFNEDRTDAGALWIRYVTVRDDFRGEGFGPPLCAFVVDAAADRGYERVRIAVNNPFAYEALYRAGFAYTGEETGLAELVLERPSEEAAMRAAERSGDRYRQGLAIYADRELSSAETAFLERKRGTEPPEPSV